MCKEEDFADELHHSGHAKYPEHDCILSIFGAPEKMKFPLQIINNSRSKTSYTCCSRDFSSFKSPEIGLNFMYSFSYLSFIKNVSPQDPSL